MEENEESSIKMLRSLILKMSFRESKERRIVFSQRVLREYMISRIEEENKSELLFK